MKNLQQIRPSYYGLAILFFFIIQFNAIGQTQENKQYVTVCILNNTYSIAYPDGTVENGKVEPPSNLKNNLGEHTSSINEVLNAPAKKGYKLVSTIYSPVETLYIFEK